MRPPSRRETAQRARGLDLEIVLPDRGAADASPLEDRMKSNALWPSKRAWIGVVGVLLLAGCTGEAPDPEEETARDAAELSNPWGHDPCKVLAPTITDQGHPHKFYGTPGPDVIFGTHGDDEIWGGGGDDIICADDGDDTVHGGGGADYIDGGMGKDYLYGDDGNDLIHGRSGGDEIHGGAGDDRLYGDLLDDKLWGDAGDDLIVGGHGVDIMHGGIGDDWLRGDTNGDEFHGDGGYDVASFATAMPPGQPQGTENSQNPIDGVLVDFTKGTANGDGADELLHGISKVIGSPFNDRFVGVGNRTIVSGYGSDTCDGKPCGGSGPSPAGKVLVYTMPHARDLGLVVLGTPGDDHVEIAAVGHTIRVTATDGADLDTGAGCSHANAQVTDVVECPIGAEALGYIVGWGDKGADTFQMTGDMPRDITVHLDGGEGDDTLVGGDEQDVLFGGRTGKDVLRGHGGDDALISESYDWDRNLPGSQYPGGGDVLDGGPGNDQLVVDYLCAGHHYIGGSGTDVAGFARSGSRPIHASLGGPLDPQNRPAFFGRGYNDLCDAPGEWQKYATYIAGDLEILEGSAGDDVLHGNDLDNVIWGRLGDDHLFGHGGDDELDGLSGNDILYGGPGRDVLRGGGGFDWIYANDGEKDAEISCGGDGGKLMSSDKDDPTPTNCGG